MQIANSQLQLRYTFVSSPSPIRASVAGAEPNAIGLTVMISDPGPRPVALAGIIIEIPMGDRSAHALSSISSLPAPASGTAGAWTLSIDGSRLVMQPAAGSTAQITDTIIITFAGIIVNHAPGVVPIKITEIHDSGSKAVDSHGYSLTKLEADFPVTDVRATPETLYDLDQTTTIFWSTSDQGKALAYSLAADDWQPRDCLNQGNCYTWQDGVNGVITPPLRQTTIFTLSVIGTDPAGGRVVLHTLPVRVRMTVPSVLQNTYVEQVVTSQLTLLHWIAVNAVRCSVFLEGHLVDSHAPADTYRRGYPLLLPYDTRSQRLAVTAYSDSGVQVQRPLADVITDPFTAIQVRGAKSGIAITPDSRLALILTLSQEGSMAVTVIDIATRTAEPAAIPLPGLPIGIAITPDGKSALVTTSNFAGDSIIVIDIPSRSLEPITIPVQTPMGLAISRDGRHGFLLSGKAPFPVTMIDVPNRSIIATIPANISCGPGIAVTPDGSLLLALSATTGSVVVIDVAARAVEPAHIPVGIQPTSIAITPDGRLALLVGVIQDVMVVVDIHARAVEPVRLPVPGVENAFIPAIAITPDGRFAFVASRSGVVTVVDIPGRRVIPGRLDIPHSAGIAITPDGTTALATGYNNDVVTVL